MYAKEENGQIKRYLQLPEYYKNWAGTFHLQTDTIHKQEGFFPLVIPEYDLATQKRGDEILWDEVNQQYYYEVIDKTQAELEEEAQRRLDALDNQFDQEAAKRLLRKVAEPLLQDETNLTEQDIEDAKMLYNHWRETGIAYEIGDKVVFNGELYKVIQAHTSQSDWTPDVSTSLFTKYRVPGTIEPWSQPESTNPYMTGDKVTHNNKTWVSDIDDNVWEPGVYGWSEL